MMIDKASRYLCVVGRSFKTERNALSLIAETHTVYSIILNRSVLTS